MKHLNKHCRFPRLGGSDFLRIHGQANHIESIFNEKINIDLSFRPFESPIHETEKKKKDVTLQKKAQQTLHPEVCFGTE
jgi:hypothetical protein